jgi:tetratricopeptide (TPR) repeat protein
MTYNLAVAYYGPGDLENTARCLAGLFTMGSGSPAVLKLAAFVAFDQGKYDTAYRYGQRCLEINPRDREMRRLLEEVREQQ